MGRCTRTGRFLCVQEAGFTYLGLLFAVALIGVSLAAVGVLWSTESRREKERQLIFVGEQFQQAIAAYYEGSPGLVKRYPAHLDDLLKDNRFLGVKRHLRRIYDDPMTGRPDWVIVRAPDGGIKGVHSASSEPTINQTYRADLPFLSSNGAAQVSTAPNALRYSDWVFFYEPLARPISK